MSEVNLKFEVHCYRPSWATQFSISKFFNSRYRIYVNDNLITERSWVWDNNIFLDEDVWVSDLDVENSLKLETVTHIPSQASFTINNFRVTNTSADIEKINDLQVNFILR
jgi:hypothetical protein